MIKVELVEGLHLTAYERAAISAGLRAGQTYFTTPRKNYAVESCIGDQYKIQIIEKDGSPKTRRVTIRLKRPWRITTNRPPVVVQNRAAAFREGWNRAYNYWANTAGLDSPRAWEIYNLLGVVGRDSSVVGLSILINHPADPRRFVTIEESKP